MNIYRKKSRLKILLLVLAVCIAAVTVLYTNFLAGKIANDEKKKVQLWAEAVQNKAVFVKYTNELFNRLEADERQKVQEWAEATRLIVKVTDNDALTFLTNVISSNDNIPIVLTDDSMRILNYRNLPDSLIEDSVLLHGDLFNQFSKYKPIEIDFQIADLRIRNFIFYKDSKLFTELKFTLNAMIESFLDDIVLNSASVPVVLTDKEGFIESFGNIDSTIVREPAKLQLRLTDMVKGNTPVVIDLGDGNVKYLYYETSPLLIQLKIFPYVQLGIMALFLLAAYLAFSSSRRAEENHVWIGMAKETAHQLGTPLSALNSWVEFIRNTPYEERRHLDIMEEVQKDLTRLNLVAERFSKIGSKPQLH